MFENCRIYSLLFKAGQSFIRTISRFLIAGNPENSSETAGGMVLHEEVLRDLGGDFFLIRVSLAVLCGRITAVTLNHTL